MLRPRVIVCLDVQDGRVVKGTRFKGLRDVGDPVELAKRYEREGADEIVFLDISASHEGRGTLLDTVRRTAEVLFIPLTVGGGVRNVQDMDALLRAGADKVSVNSGAVRDPGMLTRCAERFGSQCVVISIDAARDGEDWYHYTHGGRRRTDLEAVSWARECVERGAGEVLLTSIDRDGVRTGYDLELTRAVAEAVTVPVIASGGAGNARHLEEGFSGGKAAAVLLAGILHDGLTTVAELKEALEGWGIPVRPVSRAADRRVRAAAELDRLVFNGDGLIPVVAQDGTEGAVLMVAWANREALEKTLETGVMHYWSRSRKALWRKGETSGNTLSLLSLHADCDGDTLLARVSPSGPACHTGDPTCFGEGAVPDMSIPEGGVLEELWSVLEARDRDRPEGSYTTRLLADEDLRLKKLGEEATELIVSLVRGEARASEEAADLVYHLLVALKGAGRSWREVEGELERRRG